jgi:hypothetical protein
MNRSVAIHFEGLPPSRPFDAAARRRAGILDMTHSAVLGWQVCLVAQRRGLGELDYAATVRAQVEGGETLVGEGRGMQTLGALRLAFDHVEMQLDAHRERARMRAGQWQAIVQRRRSERQEAFALGHPQPARG